MNTTNSSIPCPSSIGQATTITNFVSYSILMPLRAMLGGTSQVIALFAFGKQTAKESGFAYQLFVSISKLIEISFFTLYVLVQEYFGGGINSKNGYEWLVSSYSLMWISAHLTLPLMISIMLSTSLSTAMAVDRVFAISKPFSYRNIDHKKHRIFALIICLLASVSTTFDFAWRYSLIDQGDRYRMVVNPAYSSSKLASAITDYRIAFRFGCIIVMTVSYLLILKNYTKRLKQVNQTTNNIQNSENAKKEKEWRRRQETLFILIAFQLPFIFFGASLGTATNLVYLLAPQLQCEGSFLGALSIVAIEISDTFELYVIFIFSKGFRRIVFKAAPFLEKIFRKGDTTTTVQAISNSRNDQNVANR